MLASLTTKLYNLKKNLWCQAFIIFTRYLIGFAFVIPSFIKIKGERFAQAASDPQDFGSAFHFFETMYQSGFYWHFIGLGQLLAGGLLMTQKYAKLGALIYLPIITNIVVIVWSLEFGLGTPIITTLVLLANLLLIIWDYDTFIVLLNKPQKISSFKSIEDDPFWTKLGLAFFAITCIGGFMNRHLSIFLLLPFMILCLLSLIMRLKTYKNS